MINDVAHKINIKLVCEKQTKMTFLNIWKYLFYKNTEDDISDEIICTLFKISIR